MPAQLPSGEVAAFTALTPDHIYNQCSVGVCAALSQKPIWGGPSDAGTNPPGLPADARRTDGYLVDDNVFQGARVYDPNANQWTTPDAYAGDVHDPMSQKPYMWNNNNAMAYSDPSGYEGNCPGCQGLGAQPEEKMPANAEHYVKLEATTGFGAVSLTLTSSGHAYISGGAGAPEPSVSVMAGTIVRNAGKTADDVVSGWSGGASFGAGVGFEAWGNASGSAVGVGVTTPWAGGTATYGVQIAKPQSKPGTQVTKTTATKKEDAASPK